MPSECFCWDRLLVQRTRADSLPRAQRAHAPARFFVHAPRMSRYPSCSSYISLDYTAHAPALPKVRICDGLGANCGNLGRYFFGYVDVSENHLKCPHPNLRFFAAGLVLQSWTRRCSSASAKSSRFTVDWDVLRISHIVCDSFA